MSAVPYRVEDGSGGVGEELLSRVSYPRELDVDLLLLELVGKVYEGAE